MDPSGEEDEVLGTVFNFDRFVIRRFERHDITILEVSGSYSSALGKTLERHANKLEANIGLDVSGVSNLQSGLISSLVRIHKRQRTLNRAFLLCNPPDRLLDFLKLNELDAQFHIVADLEEAALPQQSIVDRLETQGEENFLEETREIKPARTASHEIIRLNKSLKRTEKLEKNLDSASRCVRKILPATPPTLADYDVAFLYDPSDKVGGDFFDFIDLGHDLLGITVGDVSGHGLDSAIIMAMAKKVIRVRAKDLGGRGAREVLCQANADLYEELRSRVFITVLFAILRPSTGEVVFARAGHEPPVCFRPGVPHSGAFEDSKGLAIGMDSGRRFNEVLEERELVLSPGDGLLLYTDGIVETWNPRKDIFSRPRLTYTVEQVPSTCTAESVIKRISSAVSQFAQGVPPEDDMTAIAILRD